MHRFNEAVFLPDLIKGDVFSGNAVSTMEAAGVLVRFRRVKEGAPFVVQGYFVDGDGVRPLDNPRKEWPTKLENVDWQYVPSLASIDLESAPDCHSCDSDGAPEEIS